MAINVDMVTAYLNQYTENEKIYKEYHEALKDAAALQDFGKRYSRERAISEKIILPDLYPESIPWTDFFCDKNIFRKGHNVRIMKHDRYTPAFEHYHDVFEMNYVLSGKCIQRISGKKVSFQKGDICFIALNTPHTMEVFDDSIILNILIRHDTFDDIFLNDLRNKTILTTFFLDNLYKSYKTDHIIFHTGDDVVIRDMVLEMCVEHLEEDEFSDNLLTHMASILFSKLMRGYADTADISGTSSRELEEQIRIMDYLQLNYRTATLTETADHFYYSTAYCSRLIKKTTGSTFSALLREIRMKQAERLLRGTPANLSTIAERIGYENEETFIRVFKASRGITPTQYRNLKT